jgi:GTP-binding protein
VATEQVKGPNGPKVAGARFVAGAARAADLPGEGIPEIAFAGRSNVGKSSLLNSVMQRRSLVRTSKTPGATRAINLFEARLTTGEVLMFADLPGYGFAQRSKSERSSWGPMLEGYLTDRAELRGIVILVDVRRGLEDDDVELVEYASTLARPLPAIVCITKIDKLPVSKRKPEVIRIQRALESRLSGVPGLRSRTPPPRTLAYSAISHEGRERLWKELLALANPLSNPAESR